MFLTGISRITQQYGLPVPGTEGGDKEAYAKVSLKKYRPMAARNEDRNVFSGLL
jgi:hypothetical protein